MMMIRITLIAILWFGIIESIAQDMTATTGQLYFKDAQVFRLKAFTTMKNEWKNVIYLMPRFAEASIEFNDGYVSDKKQRLNLNLYLNRFELIAANNDTLPLPNTSNIRKLTFGDRIFYNSDKKGLLEVISGNAITYGVKYSLKMLMESSSGEVFLPQDFKLPISRFDRLYIRDDSYFLFGKDGNAQPVTLPSMIKHMPNYKTQIKTFVRTNSIDLKQNKDIFRLINFCEQLK